MATDLRFIGQLEKNSMAHPKSVALIQPGAGKSMTYAGLWEYSGRVYRFLKQEGIGKEDVVMIALARGIDPVIVLIGIWRAGAAAIMLNEDYESERMKYIMQDAGCVLKIDADLLSTIMDCTSLEGYEETSLHDLAYLIYTSGTTGKPKGVMQEYGALDMCVRMHYCGERSVIDGRFALISPLHYAVAMFVILPILYGAQTLAVIPVDTVKDPDGLIECIENHHLTTLFIIPSMLKRLKRIPASLTKIIVGGEMTKKIFSDQVEIFCGYGQSESGFNITTFQIDREYDITPIGRVGEQKAQICILDDEGRPLVNGETGNLCYKAPYFRGYLGLPELTEQVRLGGYIKSGDCAVIRPDGKIYITGRADEMIKIRGNRIEPAEVETVFQEILQVGWVGVRAIYDHQHPYLCAYYEEEPKRSVEEAVRFAGQRLPSYMIPSYFMKIDSIPREANGKIAKRNLPVPDVIRRKSMKNLYHCVTMYQVLEAIVHSERVHAGEYNVLVLADFAAKKYPDYQKLEAFFSEVRLFPYRSVSNDPDTILKETERAYASSVDHELTQFAHIYVASAFYYFSLYLIANHISFDIFEDGGGIMSKPKVLYELIRDVTPIMADIAQTYGLLDGSCRYVNNIICNFSAQSFIADNPKWKDFDPALEITRLSPEMIRRILHFYQLEPICDIPENAALIFTQQFANLYTTSLEDQIAIYQVCSDFFLPDQALIFKPHPDDTADYALYFPDARTIRERFPAELMPVLLDPVPETSFTVSSSSIRNIRSIFQKNIMCGYDFPNTFQAIDRYYFALKLLSETESLKNCPVHTFGVDVNLLESLTEHALKTRLRFVHETALKKTPDCRQIWIIDDCTFESDYFQTKRKDLSFAYRSIVVKGVEPACQPDPVPVQSEEGQQESRPGELCVTGFLETIGEEDLVIFLNSRNDYCFYDEGNKELFLRMIPIRVRKRRMREEHVFFPDGDATIYAYTPDEEIRETVAGYQARVILKHTGLEEEILQLDAEQRRAALSEGLREAEGKEPDVAAAPAAGDRILMDEYLDLAMDLNDMSMKPFLMEKIHLFLRPGLRDYMGRPALDLASASDEEIMQFLQTWGKTAGKRNTVAGDGFQIYTGSDMDLVQKIRSDGIDLLEPYICQHQAYQAIYPDSLNTIRIHTVRSSHEVRTFLTVILSVGGDGAVVDVSNSTTRYRVLLSEDGSIIEALRQDPKEPCKITQRHHNTGYPFRHGRKLPGIPACLECCRKAAFYIPEMRYIGWDVAVTEQGPVIVEANNVSGAIYTYQQAKECITGAGVRDEVEELLTFGMEGVRYNERMIYISEPFVRPGACLPDVRSLYLTLLQSALHRHGVEFYEREYIKSRAVERKHCSIRYLKEPHAVQIELEGRTELICQPEVEKLGLAPYGEDKEHPCVSEADFFALDQIAMQEAARIYRVLTQADAGSSADHIPRQEEAP